jgi:hypothetical protein
MELKVKGKFVTTSKVKNFQNPSCPILEKINENYDKKYFLAIMKHSRFMGHQSYVLLCSKITSFPPSEGEFSEKFGIFSKLNFF